MRDDATAHTANYSANILNEVFEDGMIKTVAWKASRLILVIFICDGT
jgi:hypothetical protein